MIMNTQNSVFWLSIVVLGLVQVQSASSQDTNENVNSVKTEVVKGDHSKPPVSAISLDDMTPAEKLKAMALTSKVFRSATQKAKKFLVTIESFGGVSSKQGEIGGIRGQGEGNATGVMISADGYVITSTFSFIQQPPIITVITSDGKRRVAKPLGQDDTRKLSLLKIQDVEGLDVAEFVDPDDVAVGQWAISVGVGYGDANPAISMGIISATNRIGGHAIQTDANISPANYGGPLVDIMGKVIGICVPMNPNSQAIGAGVEWYDSGIGFVVPLHNSEELIERLKNGERIYPAFLGVRSAPNPEGNGLRIEEVVKDTAAKEAGLKNADIILEVNGQAVNDLMRLKQLMNRYESGQEIELTVIPDSDESKKQVKMKLKLGKPPVPKKPSPQDGPGKLEKPNIR